MAALIKAANARIRSNPVTDYFCSTRKLRQRLTTATEVTGALAPEAGANGPTRFLGASIELRRPDRGGFGLSEEP